MWDFTKGKFHWQTEPSPSCQVQHNFFAKIPSQIPGFIGAVHAVRPPVRGPLAWDAAPVARGERRRAAESQCVRVRGGREKRKSALLCRQFYECDRYVNDARYRLTFKGYTYDV